MILRAMTCWAVLLASVSLLLLRARMLSRREAVARQVDDLRASAEVSGRPDGARAHRVLRSLTRRPRLRMALSILMPAILLSFMSGAWWSLCVTLPSGFFLYRLAGKLRHARRQALVRLQIYEFLDAMIQSLEGGFSIFQALEFSSEDVPPPLGLELRRAVADVHYGSELEEALGRLRRNVAEPDFDTAADMLLLLKQSGGNLPLLLRKLRGIMRDRAEIARDLRVYTTQGRWSGYVVSSLPIAFLVIEGLFSPSLIRPLFATPFGLTLLAAGLAMDAAGFLCVRRICRLERSF